MNTTPNTPAMNIATITYHDHDSYACNDILYDSEPNMETDRTHTFGILEINMNKTLMIKKPLFIYFTVDESDSMYDLCNGRQSKMWHLKQMFYKMMEHLGRMNDLEIYIKVAAFNNNVRTIIDTILVDKSNIDDLIKRFETIKPQSYTNIEIALDYASANISNHIQKYPDHRVTHIFLTDGDITSGSSSYSELSGIIEQLEVKCSNKGVKCRSIFVGLGETHNHSLLNQLSETKRGEYRFIDDAENAPIVYGEILSRILFPSLEDVCMNITEGGELYDWKSNSWKECLYEDLIDSEAKKTYHIRVKKGVDLSQIQINILGEEITQKKLTNYLVNGTNENKDLMKYVFRQKILEYLSGHLKYNKKR